MRWVLIQLCAVFKIFNPDLNLSDLHVDPNINCNFSQVVPVYDFLQ